MVLLLPVGLLFGRALAQRAAPRVAPRTAAMIGASTSTERHQKRKLSHGANPFSREEVLNRLGGRSLRRLTTQNKVEVEDLKEAVQNEKWFPVYRYRAVRLAVIVSRAKLLQTLGSTLFLPYAFWCYSMETVTYEWLMAAVSLAVTAPIVLLMFSRYFNRLIGVIAINETDDVVRVGYLTFWGGRKNLIAQIDDIIPLSEANGNNPDKLLKFCVYSSPKFLFLSTTNVDIVDEEAAKTIFGDLAPFDLKKKKQ